MKLGVFLPNWVGDACMATPAVRAIRNGIRSCELIAIGQPVALEVFSGTNWFDHTLSTRAPGCSRWSLVKKLRQEKLDAIVLMTNSFWTAAVSFLSRIPSRVGYARDRRSWLLTDRLQVPRERGRPSPIPAIDYYLGLARAVKCTSDDRAMEVGVPIHDQIAADDLWQRLCFSTERKTVVINSSGAYGQAKLWPKASVVELARQIAEQMDHQVLLHCGPGDRELANSTADQCDHPNIKSMGKTGMELPIGLSKAVLQRASVVVSTDSGPRHLAVALNRPVISLFGPTSPAWTTTYNLTETIFTENLTCQPCYKRACPLKHHHCMKNLSVERVFQAVGKRLTEDRQPGRRERHAA